MPPCARPQAFVFGFDREDRQKHDNSYTFYLRYEGPLPRGNDVKVDITLREQLVYPLQDRPVLRGYDEFTDLPENACCVSIRWRKSPRRKPWRSQTRRATNQRPLRSVASHVERRHRAWRARRWHAAKA